MRKQMLSFMLSAALVFTGIVTPVYAAEPAAEAQETVALAEEEPEEEIDAGAVVSEDQADEKPASEKDNESTPGEDKESAPAEDEEGAPAEEAAVSEDEITASADEVSEEDAEAAPEAITISGNAGVVMSTIEGEIYANDPDACSEAGVDIAEAVFDKTEDDTAEYSVSVYGYSLNGYLWSSYGYESTILFSVNDDGKTLHAKFGNDISAGTYFVKLNLEKDGVRVGDGPAAEYKLVVKPDISRVVVYVNKSEQSRTIYTDGKAQMSLPFSARVVNHAGKTVKNAAVTYQVHPAPQDEEAATLLKASADGKSLLISKGYTGVHTVSINAITKNRNGDDVTSDSLQLVVTAEGETPARLYYSDDDFLEADQTYSVSMNHMDNIPIEFRNASGSPIDVSVSVKGKSLKLKRDPSDDKGYIVNCTGKTGLSYITAKSKVGGISKTFTINVLPLNWNEITIVHNNGTLCNTDQEVSMPDYAGTPLRVCNLSEIKGDTCLSMGPGFKWKVTGGKLTAYEKDGVVRYYDLTFNAPTVKATLSYGSNHMTLTLDCASFESNRSTVKGVSVPLYSYYGSDQQVTVPLKGLPAGKDYDIDVFYTCDSKTTARVKKNSSVEDDIRVTYDLLNNNATVNSSGQLVLDVSGYSFWTAGKITQYIRVESDDREFVSKPIAVTFNIGKKLPKAKVKIKSVKLSKQAGSAVAIPISAKNTAGCSVLSLDNGHDKKGNANQFTSYFKLSDDKTQLVLKDPGVTKADLTGNVLVNVTLVNGDIKTMTLPIKVSIK